MGYLSNYAENKVLDHLLKVAAYPRPTHLWLGLCTGDPLDTATGGTIKEPGSNAYTRKLCDSWNAAASRATDISTAIVFPTATGTWGIMSHFAVLDTSVLATGNVIAYGPITPNKTITTSDAPIIANGDFDVSVNAGGASNYLANKLLDHLFKNTSFAQPGSIFIALSKATINDNDTGSTLTEPGQNYARIQHNGWNIAAAGASANSGAVTFAKATGGTWGTITHFALCNTLTTGNMLLHAAVTIPKQILVSDIPKWNNGALICTAD